MIRTIGYAWTRGWKNLQKHRLLSFASAGIVTVSLLFFGIFLLLEINLGQVLDRIQDQCEINVYLAQDAEEVSLTQIEKELKAIDGVAEVRFFSREERLQKVKETSYRGKESLLEEFEKENPLRDSYRITAEHLDSAGNIAAAAAQIRGVDEVTDLQDLALRVKSFSDRVGRVGVCLMLLFALGAVCMISNAIRMAFAARYREIFVMRCVGAPNGFLYGPFLVEGILLGLFGAFLSGGILLWGYSVVVDAVSAVLPTEVFAMASLGRVWAPVLGEFLGLGIGIGLIGSLISVRKYGSEKRK